MFGGFGDAGGVNTMPSMSSLNTGGLAMDTTVNTDVNTDVKSVASANMSAAKTYSIAFWVGLLVVYLAYDWLQNEKLKNTLEPANIRANAHNLILVTLAAVIGINGMNVLLTKLTAMRIPGLSKGAGSILPLFHL